MTDDLLTQACVLIAGQPPGASTEDAARAVVRLVLERALEIGAEAYENTPTPPGCEVDSWYSVEAAILALIPQAPTEGGE